MIIDTSAVVAILLNQEARPRLLAQMRQAPRLIMSAVSLYESGIVLVVKLGPGAVEEMYALLLELGVTVASFDRADAVSSIAAYQQFGKGLNPAGLNFGDCPVHTLATMYRMPVLCTTNEFIRAGLQSAL